MTPRTELARVDLRGRTPSVAELRAALPRGGVDVDSVLHQVRPVVEAIRDRGVGAALEFSVRFDGVAPAAVRVPEPSWSPRCGGWTRRCARRWRSSSSAPARCTPTSGGSTR